nr:sugar phosphate isomerase/epimerase [Chloroflexota bacterium]
MARDAALKLSFSTGTLYHCPLRIAFALACEAGFEGVELVLSPEIILRGASYVRRLSQEYALPVLSVHPPIVPYPGQNSAGSILPRLVSLAEQLDCPLVVLHVPKVTTPQDRKWAEFTDVLLRAREQANPGVQISLENPGFFRRSDAHYILHDARRLRAFADQYDLPLTFDTAHAGASSYPLMEAYELFHGRVVNVHFSDLVSRRIFPDWPPLYSFLKHHQMPGEGILPLAEFVRLLLASGYSGPFTLEVSPTAIGAWSLSRVRKGLARMIEFVRRIEMG